MNVCFSDGAQFVADDRCADVNQISFLHVMVLHYSAEECELFYQAVVRMMIEMICDDKE